MAAAAVATVAVAAARYKSGRLRLAGSTLLFLHSPLPPAPARFTHTAPRPPHQPRPTSRRSTRRCSRHLLLRRRHEVHAGHRLPVRRRRRRLPGAGRRGPSLQETGEARRAGLGPGPGPAQLLQPVVRSRAHRPAGAGHPRRAHRPARAARHPRRAHRPARPRHPRRPHRPARAGHPRTHRPARHSSRSCHQNYSRPHCLAQLVFQQDLVTANSPNEPSTADTDSSCASPGRRKAAPPSLSTSTRNDHRQHNIDHARFATITSAEYICVEMEGLTEVNLRKLRLSSYRMDFF